LPKVALRIFFETEATLPADLAFNNDTEVNVMTFEDLRSYLKKRPFTPLRLYVSGGETFDIHHPELCVVGYSSVFIGFPSPEDADSPVYARYTVVDWNQIVRLEPLSSAKPGTN
jgi:hypothetical protein